MSSAYIKELDKHIPFSHIEVFTVVNPDLIPVGTLRKFWSIPKWVNGAIMKNESGIVTCAIGEDTARFYTAPGVLIEVDTKAVKDEPR